MSNPGPPDWQPMIAGLRDVLAADAEDSLQPLRRLLEWSRDVLQCQEAGLLVPAAVGSLRFLVSVNSSEEISRIVTQLIVPCDRSIAGYVFNTGQPLAVGNVPEEKPPHYYEDVDKQTGLQTQQYLAVPVLHHDQTLGVATFVNRSPQRGDAAFTAEEIQWTGSIASLMAVMLQYHRRLESQRQVALADLAETVRQMAPGGSPLEALPGLEGGPPPLARVLTEMDAMPRSGQELLADLVELLADHLHRRPADDEAHH